MKRLVILSDGTWKSAHDPRTGAPSNVVLLSRLIKPADGSVPQIVYYDPGVGTGGGLIERVKGGITGSGLDLNIAECYRFIVQNFAQGDELYFFGFSRGAYTVRCLAGLIRKCGILKRENILEYRSAIELYRDGQHPDDPGPTAFREKWSCPECAIRMVGVFDTVGTNGIPAAFGFKWMHDKRRFHDAELSSMVQIGAQALAVDEKRRQFGAVPWDAPKPGKRHAVLQKWFVGCHSDIGGGMDDPGLSNVALHWMAENARDAGLAIDMDALQNEHKPDALAPIHESRKGFYRIWCAAHREPNAKALHTSVRERWKADHSYRPRKLDLNE